MLHFLRYLRNQCLFWIGKHSSLYGINASVADTFTILQLARYKVVLHHQHAVISQDDHSLLLVIPVVNSVECDKKIKINIF